MKKLNVFLAVIFSGFVFLGIGNISINAQSVAPGAAKLNDLQSQASGSYQNNGLNQDVGNVSTGGASGAANLLKGDSQQSSLNVVGAPANQANSTTTKKLSNGWIIFVAALLFVLIAPLVVIYKKSVDEKLTKQNDTKEAAEVKAEKTTSTTKDIEKAELDTKTDAKPEKPKSKAKKNKKVNKSKRGKKKKK